MFNDLFNKALLWKKIKSHMTGSLSHKMCRHREKPKNLNAREVMTEGAHAYNLKETKW